MFCMNCGAEQPGSANYCMNCGKPQHGDGNATEEKHGRWEYMDINDSYKVLEQRSINEDRVWAERNQLAYLANFFLFYAYFNIWDSSPGLRVLLAIFGIVITVVMLIYLWITVRAQVAWQNALRRLEEDPAFDVLKKNKARPHTDILGENMLGEKTINSKLAKFLMCFSPVVPILFGVVWVVLLFS